MSLNNSGRPPTDTISIADYIWIDGNGGLRSKTRTIKTPNDGVIPCIPSSIQSFPEWNYDGSSTGQATGSDSEVIIVPRAFFRSPFDNCLQHKYLVMCDTYKPDGTPLSDNNRHYAKEIFDKHIDKKPWYGLEQEYFMINPSTGRPGGFPSDYQFLPNCQGQYYCSVGAGNAFGRMVAQEHYEKCLNVGIQLSGINAEVAPGQWEFQVGPVEGIHACDQLWVARYILLRIAEKHGIAITFEPKPVNGDWNGSGCHTNFSTEEMRYGTLDGQNGIDHIHSAIEKLSKKHDEHMEVYGSGNELRMTGEHETSRYDTFTHGIANRGASVRIPNETVKNGKGYFEDRRPSSNCDPYLVCSKLLETVCG